jgi:hypothetical protein
MSQRLGRIAADHRSADVAQDDANSTAHFPRRRLPLRERHHQSRDICLRPALHAARYGAKFAQKDVGGGDHLYANEARAVPMNGRVQIMLGIDLSTCGKLGYSKA